MFIGSEGSEPTPDFLFVFQRRGCEAGLKLSFAGIVRTSTIPPATRRAAKQKELSWGALSINMPPLTGFSKATAMQFPQIASNKRICNHLLSQMP